MKTYFLALFFALTFIPLQALPCNSCKTGKGLYEDSTPVKIYFDINGDTFTYDTKMGSAFAGADVVILDYVLYVKYPGSNPTQYIRLGNVMKNDEAGAYTWINDGDKKLSFTFESDVKTKGDRIRFDGSLDELKPYVKSWNDLFKLEDHDATLKQQVKEIIGQKDEVLDGTLTQQTMDDNGTCGLKKAQTDESKKEAKACDKEDHSCSPADSDKDSKVQETDASKKEQFNTMLKLLEKLNKLPYSSAGHFLQGDPSSIIRIGNNLYGGGYYPYQSGYPYYGDK